MHSNHITLEGRRVKYSAIGKVELRADLQSWQRMSFAGRLHKAVVPLLPYQENL